MPHTPLARSLADSLSWRRVFKIILPTAAILLLAFAATLWLIAPRQVSYQLTLAGASPAKTRFHLLQYLQSAAARSQIQLDVDATTGSIAALDKIQRNEIDLALVQGGLRIPRDSDVRQVASIVVERLHLLVKAEFYEEACADLRALGGKSVNLGPATGGTHILGRRLLEYAGLQVAAEGQSPSERAVQLRTLSLSDINKRIDTLAPGETSPPNPEARPPRPAQLAELPDAFMIVDTLPARTVARLVKQAGYRLVPLPFHQAFSLIAVDEVLRDRDHVDQLHLVATAIPPFTYGVSPARPPEATPTIGTRLLLVAHKNVPADAVARLLPLIYDGPVNEIYHPAELRASGPEYPVHPGTTLYENRHRPFLRSEILQWLQKLAGIAGPAAGALVALWGYYRWRQVLRFTAYFHEIDELERIARGTAQREGVPEDHEQRLKYLRLAFADVQRRAISEFCGNYLRGEGVLLNLLTVIAAARERLPDLCPLEPPQPRAAATGVPPSPSPDDAARDPA